MERPKQKSHYSGKKSYTNGNKHDFRLFKESQTVSSPSILILGDSGYQGIAKLHQNSQIPVLKKKLNINLLIKTENL